MLLISLLFKIDTDFGDWYEIMSMFFLILINRHTAITISQASFIIFLKAGLALG